VSVDGWVDGWMDGWVAGWMDGGGVGWVGIVRQVKMDEMSE